MAEERRTKLSTLRHTPNTKTIADTGTLMRQLNPRTSPVPIRG